MKLKIHNLIYNWRHVIEICPDYERAGLNQFYPRISILIAGRELPFKVTFKTEADKKQTSEEALQTAQNILDKAIAEMA